MAKDFEDSFIKTSRSKPFRKGKKKTYNESTDHQVNRHQKINFRKYLDEVYEEELEEEFEDLDIDMK